MRIQAPRLFVILLIPFVSLSAYAETTFLSQNWDTRTRQTAYTLSQGSRLLPLSWFLAIEEHDSENSFLGHRVPELGFIPNPDRTDNQFELPVGFAVDPDWSGKRHVGLNCSACHTSRIQFEGTTYQIDGGPSQADVWGLLSEIGLALNAVEANPSKWSRFANRVLGIGHASDKEDSLKIDLRSFLEYYNSFINNSRTTHPWGRARTDAFGMIFNRVTAINLDIPENNMPPDAPVSYPFLWGTSWQNRVQWNGSAPNTNDIERLGRNVGEVLGVFAQTDLRKASLFRPYYRTSARRLHQIRLENDLKKLWSPKWPDQLGPIDLTKKAAGAALYERHCVSCHQIVPHGEQDTLVEVVMTPVHSVNTDPRMAENVVKGVVSTGRLEGSSIPGFAPLSDKAPRGVVVSNVGQGAIFSPFRDVKTPTLELSAGDLENQLKKISEQGLVSTKEIETFFSELGLDQAAAEALVQKYEEKVERFYYTAKAAYDGATIESPEEPDPGDDTPQTLAYKAGPLAGIWATAPYLHNGSVPNLYELLLPSDRRSKKFYVGNLTFDPVRVGYVTDESDSSTLLDTSLPGNRNIGHDMYGTFSEEERWELVEFMKSL